MDKVLVVGEDSDGGTVEEVSKLDEDFCDGESLFVRCRVVALSGSELAGEHADKTADVGGIDLVDSSAKLVVTCISSNFIGKIGVGVV